MPYRLTPVPDDWWAYAPGAEWVEPDVDAAAGCMRHVWEHQKDASVHGVRARGELLERCSLQRTAEYVESRVLGVVDSCRGHVSGNSCHGRCAPCFDEETRLEATLVDALTPLQRAVESYEQRTLELDAASSEKGSPVIHDSRSAPW